MYKLLLSAFFRGHIFCLVLVVVVGCLGTRVFAKNEFCDTIARSEYRPLVVDELTKLNTKALRTEGPKYSTLDPEINQFIASRLKEFTSAFCELKTKAPSRKYVVLAFRLGCTYYSRLENYSKSEYFFYEALMNSDWLEPIEKAILLGCLADVEKIQSNLVNALYFYNLMLDTAEESGFTYYTFVAKRELGIIYRDLGQYDNAMKFLNEANQNLEELPDLPVEGLWLHLHLGRLFRETDDWYKAKQHIEQGLKGLKKNKNKHFIEPYLLYEYGLYFMDVGKVDSASLYYQQIIDKVFSDTITFDKYMVSPAYYSLGEIALQNSDSAKAIHHFRMAYLNGIKIGATTETRKPAERLMQLLPSNSPLSHEVKMFLLESYRASADFERKSNRFASQLQQLRDQNQRIELEEQKNKQSRFTIIILALGLASLIVLLVVLYRINHIRHRAIQKLKQKTKDLNNLNSIKKNLLTIVSHEVKSPIASLSFLVKELLNKNIQKYYTDESLLQINNELDRVQLSVDNVLKWANHQESGLITNPGFYKLKDCFEDSLKVLRGAQHKKSIEVKVDLPGNAQVWIDWDHLILILRNILSNAIKFSKANSSICISAEVQGQFWKTQIADQGIGMTKETIEAVFNSKSVSSQTGTSGEKGTGLGLKITKRLIEQNHGRLFIQSQKGLGTTVSLMIPKTSNVSRLPA